MAADNKFGQAQPPNKTRRGLAPLGQSIERIANPVMRRRGFAGAAIATHWLEIVGRPLSDHSQPFRIVFPRGERRGGTLHLTVAGAFAPEVIHLSPQIIERINGYFGYGAVDRLELHHGRIEQKIPDTTARDDGTAPTPPPNAQLTATIAKVEDQDLRTALARLARARAASGGTDD